MPIKLYATKTKESAMSGLDAAPFIAQLEQCLTEAGVKVNKFSPDTLNITTVDSILPTLKKLGWVIEGVFGQEFNLVRADGKPGKLLYKWRYEHGVNLTVLVGWDIATETEVSVISKSTLSPQAQCLKLAELAKEMENYKCQLNLADHGMALVVTKFKYPVTWCLKSIGYVSKSNSRLIKQYNLAKADGSNMIYVDASGVTTIRAIS